MPVCWPAPHSWLLLPPLLRMIACLDGFVKEICPMKSEYFYIDIYSQLKGGNLWSTMEIFKILSAFYPLFILWQSKKLPHFINILQCIFPGTDFQIPDSAKFFRTAEISKPIYTNNKKSPAKRPGYPMRQWAINRRRDCGLNTQEGSCPVNGGGRPV